MLLFFFEITKAEMCKEETNENSLKYHLSHYIPEVLFFFFNKWKCLVLAQLTIIWIKEHGKILGEVPCKWEKDCLTLTLYSHTK